MSDQWYYRLFGEEFGPVARSTLDSMIDSGQLGMDDEVRLENEAEWRTVRQLANAASTARGSEMGTAVEEGTVMSLDALGALDLEEAPNASPRLDEAWFYQSLGQEWGPYSFEELLELARRGDLSPDDQIRLGANGKWRRAGSMGRLMAVMPFQNPSATPTDRQSPSNFRLANDEFETKVPLIDETVVIEPRPAPPPPPPPAVPVSPSLPVPGYPTYGGAYVPQGTPTAWGMMPAAPAVDQGWYAWVGGVECGPMEFVQLMNWIQTGRLAPQDYVKQGRYSQWTPAESIPGLVPAPPPVTKPVAPANGSVEKTPARTVAATPPTTAPTPEKAVPSPAPTPPATNSNAPRPRPASLDSKPAETKPALPPDAPPERPPSDWNTSSAVSTFGTGPGAMTANRPFTPPKKLTPPSKGKNKNKKSGGQINVGALLTDKRVLGGVGVVLLIVLGYFGWGLLPEGSGKLVAAHQEISKILKEVENKVAANPAEKDWAEFGKSIKKKTAEVSKTITNSKHQARTALSGAASAINFAVGKKSPQEAEERLKDAQKKLDEAKKKLNI